MFIRCSLHIVQGTMSLNSKAQAIKENLSIRKANLNMGEMLVTEGSIWVVIFDL